MNLVENEKARWTRDGYLHLAQLIPPVMRTRIRDWVAAAGVAGEPEPDASDVRGASAVSAAALAKHHAGLNRVLSRGLMVQVAGQLLGGPALPQRREAPAPGPQLTCIVGLGDEGETIEVSRGGHEGEGEWESISLGAGDLLWVHSDTPIRVNAPTALFLDYGTPAVHPTFDWTEKSAG